MQPSLDFYFFIGSTYTTWRCTVSNRLRALKMYNSTGTRLTSYVVTLEQIAAAAKAR